MAQREIWQSENAEAIERYNDYVSSNKTFSDQERKILVKEPLITFICSAGVCRVLVLGVARRQWP